MAPIVSVLPVAGHDSRVDHEAELARLTPFVARVMRLLLEVPPKLAAARLHVPPAQVYEARRVACRILGDASPLAMAIPPWKRGRSSVTGPVGQLSEPTFVALLTTPGPDGHVHVARFNDFGNGKTDLVAGHLHRVDGLDIVPTDHGHELTERRA